MEGLVEKAEGGFFEEIALEAGGKGGAGDPFETAEEGFDVLTTAVRSL